MADPSWWGLERRGRRLFLEGVELGELAARYGTPLHVVSARTLRRRARELRDALAPYPGEVRLRFSYKTNAVPGVLRILHQEGLGAEVVDGYELWLARRLGVADQDVVFNGPFKTDPELDAATSPPVGLIVVDSAGELGRLAALVEHTGRRADIALRLCPDIVPRGMNASSSTGSRRSQFGLEAEEELDSALRVVARAPRLRLRGLHAHIGSGIHDLGAFRRAADKAIAAMARAFELGLAPDLLDLGGGLGTRFSRELSSFEMLRYLATGRLPREPRPAPESLFRDYGTALAEAVDAACRRLALPVPALVLEPGRALVSDAGMLLLRVGETRERRGVGRFALTDGGAMTVSMMFLSELHAVLLANREAPVDGKTSIFGRLPSPMDVVYRNLPFPRLERGDLLAVMDAGAYFTSTATNFGGPRPAVVVVEDGAPRLVWRRETYQDLVAGDLEGLA